MGYSRGANTSLVEAWYDNWGDLTGDIADAGRWVWNAGRQTQRAGTGITNVGNNAANATSTRIDVNTVLLVAAAGGVVYLLAKRRSNPAGRRRRRREGMGYNTRVGASPAVIGAHITVDVGGGVMRDLIVAGNGWLHDPWAGGDYPPGSFPGVAENVAPPAPVWVTDPMTGARVKKGDEYTFDTASGQWVSARPVWILDPNGTGALVHPADPADATIYDRVDPVGTTHTYLFDQGSGAPVQEIVQRPNTPPVAIVTDATGARTEVPVSALPPTNTTGTSSTTTTTSTTSATTGKSSASGLRMLGTIALLGLAFTALSPRQRR